MIVPAGINEAVGTKHVLRKLGLSPHEIVASGDSITHSSNSLSVRWPWQTH